MRDNDRQMLGLGHLGSDMLLQTEEFPEILCKGLEEMVLSSCGISVNIGNKMRLRCLWNE